jgi:asparagine synthase (glutamine-hydrolysing)
MRAHVLSETMQDSGLFDQTALARLLDEHQSGRFDHSAPLWLLLVLDGFLATELAGSPAAPPREMVPA